jgi:hypothetical protein
MAQNVQFRARRWSVPRAALANPPHLMNQLTMPAGLDAAGLAFKPEPAAPSRVADSGPICASFIRRRSGLRLPAGAPRPRGIANQGSTLSDTRTGLDPSRSPSPVGPIADNPDSSRIHPSGGRWFGSCRTGKRFVIERRRRYGAPSRRFDSLLSRIGVPTLKGLIRTRFVFVLIARQTEGGRSSGQSAVQSARRASCPAKRRQDEAMR